MIENMPPKIEPPWWARRILDLEAALQEAIEYLEPRLAGKPGSRGLTIVLPKLREVLYSQEESGKD